MKSLDHNDRDNRREQLQDRLTEQQLREAFDAETPPDLSSQILAAADRPAESDPTAPKSTRVVDAPASARSPWRDLAIAACLLVLIGGGLCLVVVANYQSRRQRSVVQRIPNEGLALTELAPEKNAQPEETRTLRAKAEFDAEAPDGRIVGINETKGTVWINLGSADGLRPMTGFSVFPHDVAKTQDPNAGKKASIQVIRIVGEHLAEARITEDVATNPIVRDDTIFSPILRRGPDTFAVAGFVDLDGDDRSDLPRLINVIKQNGGDVDVAIDEKGQRIGTNIKPTTKFLVLGEQPDEKSKEKMVQQYRKMLDEAEANGVRHVSLSDFLVYMGYEGRGRSIGLGQGADPDQFKTQSGLAVTDPTASPFRRRRPVAGTSPESGTQLDTHAAMIANVQNQVLNTREKYEEQLAAVTVQLRQKNGQLRYTQNELKSYTKLRPEAPKQLEIFVTPNVVNQPSGNHDLLGQVIAEKAGRGIDAVQKMSVVCDLPAMDVDEVIAKARQTKLTDPQGAQADLALVYGLVIVTHDVDPVKKKEMLAKIRNELTPETQKKVEAQLGTGPDDPGDQYVRIIENEFLSATDRPLSTFSIDVDTASYANVRQFLLQSGRLPPPDAVRIEELVNYFDYDYAGPQDEVPFASHMEVAACPWQPKHRLLRIALKGKEVDNHDRPNSNLVFLIDVSGSMQDSNKLPLCVAGMKLLADELNENDRVAIVVYANSEGLVLPSTPGARKDEIIAALDRLQAGGSTNGGAGIQLAYQVAQDNFIKDGINRVILCTDGDFNVGTTSTGQLQRMAEEKAKTGVFLTVLGFGRGNLNDAMMETISNKGNGNYAYIDGLTEAKKVLIEQMSGTLMTIAKDVKIQVEFNPVEVFAYRLIGYENRVMAAEDFNDDLKDAGEIGAGHTVTALYEIVPHPKKDEQPTAEPGDVDALKYQRPARLSKAAANGELLTLKLRYKQPDGDTSRLLQFPLKDDGKKFGQASEDFKFASSVAAFGMLLRGSQYAGMSTIDAVLEIAQSSQGQDKHGYRAEFLEMVREARRLGK